MKPARQTSSADLLIGLARAIPAIALAILFAWMAYFVRGNGGREIDWFGPAFFAVLAGASAVWTIWRAWARPAGPKAAKAVEPDEPAFDADAAIRRYLASKGDAASAAAPERDAAAPRPVFGRKLS